MSSARRWLNFRGCDGIAGRSGNVKEWHIKQGAWDKRTCVWGGGCCRHFVHRKKYLESTDYNKIDVHSEKKYFIYFPCILLTEKPSFRSSEMGTRGVGEAVKRRGAHVVGRPRGAEGLCASQPPWRAWMYAEPGTRPAGASDTRITGRREEVDCAR